MKWVDEKLQDLGCWKILWERDSARAEHARFPSDENWNTFVEADNNVQSYNVRTKKELKEIEENNAG